MALFTSDWVQATLSLSLQDFLTSLVNLQLDDAIAHLGGVANRDLSTRRLFFMDPFNVVHKLLTVAVDTLADLLSLVLAADDLNLVLTNGHGLDSVLLNSSV